MEKLIQIFLVVIFVVTASSISASPWLESDDAYLRSDLQLLADTGIITMPVNTFPLPWREISEQIKIASPSKLTKNNRQAYAHVLFKINAAKKGYGSHFLKLKASQKNMPSSFGQENDVEWGAFSNIEIDESRFSMRVSSNYAQYHDKSDPQFNFDNSYFAVTTGKTNFFFNTQPQWWSPSWVQSLSAEYRVHPAYELGGERTFINLPLLGDVYFKSGINQLRSDDDWKYSWRSRLSLRPVNEFELSFSYFDFNDAQNSDAQDNSNQWSMDSRLSLMPIIDLPLAVYMQQIIDDSQAESFEYLLGSDYSLLVSGTQMRFVLEYHHSEEDDINEKRYSFGSYVQMRNDHQWQLFLHHNSRDDVENQLAGSYRFLFYKGMLSLSLLLSDTDDDSDKVNTGLAWELRF
jgi:hypothetical protein